MVLEGTVGLAPWPGCRVSQQGLWVLIGVGSHEMITELGEADDEYT